MQIVGKSVKDIKQKSFSYQDFADNLDSREKFEHLKSPKVEFHYKSIIPIPSFKIKAFINLLSFNPYLVAKAFFDEMHEFANFCQIHPMIVSKVSVIGMVTILWIVTARITLQSRTRMKMKMDSTADLLKWSQTILIHILNLSRWFSFVICVLKARCPWYNIYPVIFFGYSRLVLVYRTNYSILPKAHPPKESSLIRFFRFGKGWKLKSRMESI